MTVKGCVGAVWQSIIEYKAPSDTMIAGFLLLQPPPCNYVQMHRRFQSPARWWQGTPRGISWHGTVQLSFLSLNSSHCRHPHQSLPESCLICFWKHLHNSVGIFSIFFFIFNSHVFSLHELFILFPRLQLLMTWCLYRVFYEPGMAGHLWIDYHL